VCVECLHVGAELTEPALTHEQLVAIAGNCSDIRHRLNPVCDDLLPEYLRDVPSLARVAAHAAVVVSGLVLAGGAAYGVVPGELGHHGAVVVDAPDTKVVYVDAGTESEGPSVASSAFPQANVSVLATRDVDGSCAFLRDDRRTTKIATTPPGSPCMANAAPKHGWSFASKYGSFSK
jgi:hypothetical protein